jgi:uncharacterized protein with FMN-binding domain
MNCLKGTHLSSDATKFLVALFGIALSVSLGGCKFAAEIKGLVIADVSLASVKDGDFGGSQDNSPITAKVQVEVKDGKINSIKVLEHKHGPGHGAEAIIDRVMAAQSLKVDAISGATLSSKVMLKAIESALEKGR